MYGKKKHITLIFEKLSNNYSTPTRVVVLLLLRMNLGFKQKRNNP